MEDQKLLKQAQTLEDSVTKKVDKVKQEQQTLLNTLSYQQRRMEYQAMLVEAHAVDIEKVFTGKLYFFQLNIYIHN